MDVSSNEPYLTLLHVKPSSWRALYRSYAAWQYCMFERFSLVVQFAHIVERKVLPDYGRDM